MTAPPTSPLVPSPESLRALRITGCLVAVGATGLLVAAAALWWRDRIPAPLLWMQFLGPLGLLGVAVGFVTITPEVGRLGDRFRKQSVMYKAAGGVTLCAFVAVLTIVLSYRP